MTRYLFQKPRISSGYYSGAVSYDRDGRLVADSTRHIAAVEYEAWGGLLPRTIDMGADKINLRYRPDGRLALRQHARRYMEIYRDSRGNVRERWRTALDTRTYRGSFELHGSRWLYHTDCGFITLVDGVAHYYARDYQGSTRAVYTPRLAEVSPLSVSPTMPEPYFIEQATDYYPSGLPVDVTASVSGGAVTAATTDRFHIGNRWIDHAGLGWYDNTARYHDAILARFTAPDPLEYKYPSVSPYTHCAANPANLTDPTGRELALYFGNKYYKCIDTKEGFTLEDYDIDEEFQHSVASALRALGSTRMGHALISFLMMDKNRTIIEQAGNETVDPYKQTKFKYSPSARTIYWDVPTYKEMPAIGTDAIHGQITLQAPEPVPTLGHEAYHAVSHILGFNNNKMSSSYNVTDEEIRAVIVENMIRASLDLPIRVGYGTDFSANGFPIKQSDAGLLFDPTKTATRWMFKTFSPSVIPNIIFNPVFWKLYVP